MKFGDMIKSFVIILIFTLLYFSSVLTKGINDMKENWPKYRCSPTYMPFASYVGKDPIENFSYCVGNIQKDLMGFFLSPIKYVLGNITKTIVNVLSSLNFIRELINKLRKAFGWIISDVYGMFFNILIQFQKLIIKTKDTSMKLIGIISTFIYLIQGANFTGKSIYNGPIGQTLRTICFSKNTKIKLKNGTLKRIIDIKLGDILENNSEVYGTLRLKGGKDSPYYKIWSDKLNEYIYVTGEHKIFKSDNTDNNSLQNYIPVKDYSKAIKTGAFDIELHCLITSNHQIPIGEFTFWDWED
jgi:hypothetical protein